MSSSSSRAGVRGLIVLGALAAAVALMVVGIWARRPQPLPAVAHVPTPPAAAPAPAASPQQPQVVAEKPAAKDPPPRFKKSVIGLGDVLREEPGAVRYVGGRFGTLLTQGTKYKQIWPSNTVWSFPWNGNYCCR